MLETFRLSPKGAVASERFIASSQLEHDKWCAYVRIARAFRPSLTYDLGLALSKNSTVCLPGLSSIARATSAYYTLSGGELIVEYGVMENGSTILHDELRQCVNYFERHEKGAVVRSGHTCQVNFVGQGIKRVCLIDSLTNGRKVTPQYTEYPILTTMINCGMFPISSDGYPITFA